jgi:hypothetical protein
MEINSTMAQQTLEEAARRYTASTPDNDPVRINSFIAGAKWQREQYSWKRVYDETPPSHIELLVKSPDGIVHLSSWRESYAIFSCQDKRESSLDWQWKTI